MNSNGICEINCTLSRLEGKIDKIDEKVDGLRGEFTELKIDFSGFKRDMVWIKGIGGTLCVLAISAAFKYFFM